MVPDGSDTVQICSDEAVACYLQGFQMVPEMVPDGSDMVQMCPDEAVAYYLQGFQMLPEMVPDGSDTVPGGSGWFRCGSEAEALI